METTGPGHMRVVQTANEQSFAMSMSSGMRLFQLIVLALSVWAVSYGRFVVGPLQETMRTDLALSDNQMAMLQGPAFAIPMALGSIPFGLLANRFPRVRLFLFFAALNIGAILLTALASNFAMLLLARFLAGLALAAVIIAGYSVIGDLYAPAQRGRATMVVSIGEIGAAPAAFALGGFLLVWASAIGGEIGLADWRVALLWMCVPLIPIMLLMLTLREPPRSGVVEKHPTFRVIWPEFWTYRSIVVPLLLARIMVWIADGAVLVWGAPTFSRNYGLSPDKIGAIMGTLLLVSGLLGPILGGPMADLCQRTGGPRRTMLAMSILALLSAPAALFGMLPDPTLASIALGIFLTLGFIDGVAATALSIIALPGELRSLFLAVTVTVGGIVSIGVAPLMVSGLSVLIGGPATIAESLAIVCGLTSILGAVVFYFGRMNFSDIPER